MQITDLTHMPIWQHFYEITKIPRPSKHEEQILAFLKKFAEEHNLDYAQDKTGNIVIRKGATPGMEDRETIILQGHVDMVCEKNSDVEHDFYKDPIKTQITDGWIHAEGTTLGADNGIGVAAGLAVLTDPTVEHGPVECLFTVDEETGLTGAMGIEPGFVQGRILINLDSEDAGEMFIGCAGGMGTMAFFDYTTEATPAGQIALEVKVSGLKGGHSGVDIHLGRANANKLMARLLKEAVSQCGALVAEIDGGNMRNAIPREAVALLSVKEDDTEALWELVSDYEELFNKEFAGIENHITVSLERCDRPKTILPDEIQDALIHALNACQNGVISMLSEFPDTVEASSNLAQVQAGEGHISVRFLVRSSSDSRKMWVASSIESCFLLMDARVEFDASYTGWQPNAESHIMQVMCQAAKEIYGKDPAVKVMHAGLECGIIQGVMPDMDMISFGPEIQHPHSPDERVSISSVERSYRMLVRALELI